MSTVEARAVTKRYGTVAALDAVSLAFADGEFFALLGPSGSGKTTLLRAVAGFVAPDAGDILIDGNRVNDVPPHRRDIGMVFQNYALFPHMSVLENVAFGLTVRGVDAAEARARVGRILELVRLGGYEQRRPRQLSGGQQQRVALARALVTRPRVLLLDEPLGALDRRLRQQMQIELRQIQREVGITAIFVTHDQEEALTLSDRIALINEGRVVQVGPPGEVYERPADVFAARFLGDANLFEGTVAGPGRVTGAAASDLATADPLPTAGSPVILAVRPEKLALFAAGEDAGAGQGAPPVPGARLGTDAAQAQDVSLGHGAVMGPGVVVGPGVAVGGTAGGSAAGPSPYANRLPGTIRQLVYAGNSVTYLVESGGRELIVFAQNREAATHPPGTAVTIAFRPEHAVVVRP